MRTLLGILASIPFLFVLSGMVVMLAFSRTYFDSESLSKKIIPDSYNNATLLIAEHFSATDREMTSVIVERVRALISPKDYSDIIQTGFDESMKSLQEAQNTEEINLNLVPIKNKLTGIIESSTGKIGNCTEKEELKSQVLMCVPHGIGLEEGRAKMMQNLKLLVSNEIPDVATFKNTASSDGVASSTDTVANENLRNQFKQMVDMSAQAGLVHSGITVAIVVAILVYALLQLILQFSAHRVMYFVGGLTFFVSGMVRTIASNIADLPRAIGLQNSLTYGQEQLIRFVISEPLPLLKNMSTVLSIVGLLIIVCGFLYKRQSDIRKSDVVL